MKRLQQQLKHPSRGGGTSNWQKGKMKKKKKKKSKEDWQKQLYHLSALLFVSGLCKNRTLVSLPGFLAAGEGWGLLLCIFSGGFWLFFPGGVWAVVCTLE